MHTSPMDRSATVLPAWLAAIPTALGRDLWIVRANRLFVERDRAPAGGSENPIFEPSPQTSNDR